METKQVQQLKLNVTNISSFLKQSNKTYFGLKKKNSDLLSNQVKEQKLQKKEKKIETNNITGFGLGKVGNEIAATGGSIFDKILGFGSYILAGILVNSLPAIFKKVMEFVDNIVNFVTPIYSGFRLLQAIITKEPLDDPELSPEKKRFTDELKKAKLEVDKIQKNLGIGGFILTPIQLFINEVIRQFGGNSIVLATRGGKEGFLDTNTDTFFEKQFTSAERIKYETMRRQGMSGAESTADSPDLKTAIRRAESGNDYGATFRAYLDGFSRRNEDITNMSINQVVQYQNDYLAHQRRLGIPEKKRSAAVGAYQMLLPDIAASKTGVPLTAKFNKENQDRMVDYYLNEAGYQQFIQGKITAAQFNDRLAVQFASLKTTSGSGVYDNDGSANRAYENLLDLIRKSKPQLKPSTKRGDQASALNTTIGEEGSTTIIYARQQVIT